MVDTLPWTGNDEADRLLATDPLALLIGMLLDQQIKMEWAFTGPWLITERLGTALDAAEIAHADPDEFAAVFQGPPAIHRYWKSMAKRTQDLCRVVADEYDGDAAAIWAEASDVDGLYRRLRALPGYGDAKARIFIGILGKRLGVAPEAWESRAADWASIADVAQFSDIETIREEKRKAKQG